MSKKCPKISPAYDPNLTGQVAKSNEEETTVCCSSDANSGNTKSIITEAWNEDDTEMSPDDIAAFMEEWLKLWMPQIDEEMVKKYQEKAAASKPQTMKIDLKRPDSGRMINENDKSLHESKDTKVPSMLAISNESKEEAAEKKTIATEDVIPSLVGLPSNTEPYKSQTEFWWYNNEVYQVTQTGESYKVDKFSKVSNSVSYNPWTGHEEQDNGTKEMEHPEETLTSVKLQLVSHQGIDSLLSFKQGQTLHINDVGEKSHCNCAQTDTPCITFRVQEPQLIMLNLERLQNIQKWLSGNSELKDIHEPLETKAPLSVTSIILGHRLPSTDSKEEKFRGVAGSSETPDPLKLISQKGTFLVPKRISAFKSSSLLGLESKEEVTSGPVKSNIIGESRIRPVSKEEKVRQLWISGQLQKEERVSRVSSNSMSPEENTNVGKHATKLSIRRPGKITKEEKVRQLWVSGQLKKEEKVSRVSASEPQAKDDVTPAVKSAITKEEANKEGVRKMKTWSKLTDHLKENLGQAALNASM